ncbi:DUF916 and DUF3324 domain-containing protein [Enterococcus faecalis]
MSIRRIIPCLLFVVSVAMLFCLPKVFADKPSSDNPSYNYTVVPHFGATQKKETTSFYDMTLPPEGSDTFRLEIVNQSAKEQNFQVKVNTATTNSNGIVDYTKAQFKKDSSMKLELSKLIQAETDTLTIAGKQTKTVSFTIKMPKEAFEGILLGSVVVRPIKIADEPKEIQNVFMHTLAIRVNEQETKVSPDLKGGDVHIGQENLHNTVKMTIRNPQPKLMTQMEGTFFVTKHGTDKKFVEVQKKGLSIAPNSQFDVPLQVKDQFQAGRYDYTVELKSAEGTWRFTKEFTIKKAEADQYNKTSVDPQRKATNHWIVWLLVFIILVLLVLILYLLNQRRKIERLN